MIQSECKVLAYHFLSEAANEESWVIIGKYNHELVKGEEDGNWRISKMKLIAEKQLGNLALIVEATQRKKMQ